MDIRDAIYVRHNEKYGVLVDNETETITHIFGTDLTVWSRKDSGKTYLLVPLTRNHRIEPHADWLKVDGKTFRSKVFWRQNGCQCIEVQKNLVV